MAQAIDFKQMRSSSYQMHRVVSAPGVWGQVYRDRVKRLKSYRSAVIFPEMVLGLDQRFIYDVFARQGSQPSVIVSIAAINPNSLHFSLGYSYKPVTSLQNILDYEAMFYEKEHLNTMLFLAQYPPVTLFVDAEYLFTNKKDAYKCATQLMSSRLGSNM